MKRNIKKSIFSILLLLTATASATNNKWSSGTAYTLPEGRLEVGLFQPVRFGQTDRLEWSTHPIWDFVIPNFSVKLAWSPRDSWILASRHSIVYPTPLLRRITHAGKYGIVSPEFSIPHMISIKNELISSRRFGGSTLVTRKVGFSLAMKLGKLDERSTIDLPIIFPRLQIFYHGYGFNVGIDLLRKITRQLDYLMDVDMFLFPGSEEAVAFEHKSLLVWNKSSKFQVNIGYKLIFGEYPFGTEWHLFPLFDLQWGRSF